LPELQDRPLFIQCEVFWRYEDSRVLLHPDHDGEYVDSEQMCDIACTVFEQLNSRSIQELVYVMGQRMLERFEQLVEVRFVAHNRTWDKAAVHPDNPELKVYWKARDPYGRITLTLSREDV
jgi:urate oxidase / 2-oxo-4-hydroxy-4-carboxy-5-ureidoimidazoline decarboxylase